MCMRFRTVLVLDCGLLTRNVNFLLQMGQTLYNPYNIFIFILSNIDEQADSPQEFTVNTS